MGLGGPSLTPPTFGAQPSPYSTVCVHSTAAAYLPPSIDSKAARRQSNGGQGRHRSSPRIGFFPNQSSLTRLRWATLKRQAPNLPRPSPDRGGVGGRGRSVVGEVGLDRRLRLEEIGKGKGKGKGDSESREDEDEDEDEGGGEEEEEGQATWGTSPSPSPTGSAGSERVALRSFALTVLYCTVL